MAYIQNDGKSFTTEEIRNLNILLQRKDYVDICAWLDGSARFGRDINSLTLYKEPDEICSSDLLKRIHTRTIYFSKNPWQEKKEDK